MASTTAAGGNPQPAANASGLHRHFGIDVGGRVRMENGRECDESHAEPRIAPSRGGTTTEEEHVDAKIRTATELDVEKLIRNC